MRTEGAGGDDGGLRISSRTTFTLLLCCSSSLRAENGLIDPDGSLSIGMTHSWRSVCPCPLEPHLRIPLDSPLELPLPEGESLSLEHTLRCGQVFRWRESAPGVYRGPFRESAVEIGLHTGRLRLRAVGPPVAVGEIWRFLGLDHSVSNLTRGLDAEPWVHAAFDALPGLRIVRQDPWECVLTFLCAQWSNVRKIENSLEALARGWGSVRVWPDGGETAVMPPPAVFAGLRQPDLQPAGLGYRWRYVVQASRQLAAGEVALETLRCMPYPEALDQVSRLAGVGRKVADCILLFSLDQPGACPVDVWVRRIFHECCDAELRAMLPDFEARRQGELSAIEHRAILCLAQEKWGDRAGWVQQYLFHARRLGLLAPPGPGGPV